MRRKENKKDAKDLPFEVEDGQTVDEVTIMEDEKKYSEKDLPAGFEDLLYEEWCERKMGIDENYEKLKTHKSQDRHW
jgi:hypothetical protein